MKPSDASMVRKCLQRIVLVSVATGWMLYVPAFALGNDQPKREVLLERVEKIYTDGRWNGRPTIVFWKGHYYTSSRSGTIVC